MNVLLRHRKAIRPVYFLVSRLQLSIDRQFAAAPGDHFVVHGRGAAPCIAFSSLEERPYMVVLFGLFLSFLVYFFSSKKEN